jgi:translation initiation factor IF-2
MARKVTGEEQATKDKAPTTPKRGAKAEAKTEVQPETKAEPRPRAKPVAKTEAKTGTKQAAKTAAKTAAKPAEKAEAEPSTRAVAKPVTKAADKPVTKPEVKVEAKPEAKAADKPVTKPEVKTEVKPEAKAEAEAKPEVRPEPEVAVKEEVKPEIKVEPRVEAKPVVKPSVVIPHRLTVKQLADILGISAIDAIKHLMRKGVMASMNQVIEYEIASVVAEESGFEVKKESAASTETVTRLRPQAADEIKALKPRPPVVTIMGHVDHGKTKLLDAIRQTNVVDTEAGQITQHIGAYQVEVRGQKITFLDTPGHEAFTAMRARGAQVTDIAVLVVAADDGVMPQTIEAINHAKAAGVPIVVAINKVDKPTANVERVKQQLADHGVIIEEWGGDVIAVPVSAKRGDGISDLLENLLLVAEVEELKADPNRPAVGVVIEARLDSSRGSLATILVQTGTLEVGDYIVVGDNWGRVKAMFDDKGRRVRKAEPSTPVSIMGLSNVPQAGDILTAVGSEREARAEAERRRKEKESSSATRTTKLSSLFAQIQAGSVKELNIVLKTDVQGSIEPIKDSLEKLGTSDIKVRIVHAGSGSITENDVLLAIASKGIIIGFNTRPEPGAKRLADQEGVDIRSYQVIYTLVEDVGKALAGMLEPTYAEVIEGHGEVRAVFNISKGKIAGVYVTDGKISRGSSVRVLRKGQVIFEGQIASLKHFKENVREIASGFECGVGIEGFSDFEVGDILESYRKERV